MGKENALAVMTSEGIGPSDTTTETSLLSGTISGSLSIPARKLTDGDAIRITLGGTVLFGIPGASTITIRFKVGSAVISKVINQPGSIINPDRWWATAFITIVGTGPSATIVATGILFFDGNPQAYFTIQNGSIDTTVVNTVDFTAQFGITDPNTFMNCDTALLEHLSP